MPEGAEFRVPPCPYFVKKVAATSGGATPGGTPWAEVPRVPEEDDDGGHLSWWNEVPRLPEEEEEVPKRRRF